MEDQRNGWSVWVRFRSDCIQALFIFYRKRSALEGRRRDGAARVPEQRLLWGANSPKTRVVFLPNHLCVPRGAPDDFFVWGVFLNSLKSIFGVFFVISALLILRIFRLI
ncbi:MAG: hypothetical protein Q4E13_09610 [Clostridia bacterium]|nr:hypothetical protein [Clostridia bacterium]